jgi:hypothetical protein
VRSAATPWMCRWVSRLATQRAPPLAACLVAGVGSGNWTQEQGLVGRQEIGRAPSRSPPRPVFDISFGLPSYTALFLSVNCSPFAYNPEELLLQPLSQHPHSLPNPPTNFPSLPPSSLYARNTKQQTTCSPRPPSLLSSSALPLPSTPPLASLLATPSPAL